MQTPVEKKPAPLKSVKEMTEACPTCISGVDPSVAVTDFQEALRHAL